MTNRAFRSLLLGVFLSLLAAPLAAAQQPSENASSHTFARNRSGVAQSPYEDAIVGRLAVGAGYGTHDVFSVGGAMARGGGPHLDVRVGVGRKLTSQDYLLAEVYWQKPFIVAGGEVVDEESGEASSARIQSVVGFGLAYERHLRLVPWSIGGGISVLYRPLDVSTFRDVTGDMVQGGGLGVGVEVSFVRYWSVSDAFRLGASLAGGSQLYFDEGEQFVAGYMSARLVMAFQ